MKPEALYSEELLQYLDDLKYISQFVMYEKFGYDKNKLKKGLKKIRKKVKQVKLDEILDLDFYDNKKKRKKV